MSHPTTRTRLSAASLIAVLALAGGTLVACGSDDTGNNENSSHSDSDHSSAGVETSAQVELQSAMRVLWNEHANLTVRAIVAAVGGLDETGAVVDALQANQDKIGDAIKPYYGDEAGEALAALLHEHIDTAVATVTAAVGGDQAELKKASDAFYANGDEIAAFLAKANPENWPLDAMEEMMKMHLDQVVDLATLQIKGDHEQALAVYEAYVDHINVGLADGLTAGIVAQFPDKF